MCNEQIAFFLIDQFEYFFILANNEKKLNNTNAERYFAVETARGYIIINRE
jgi:hypothetical protein